MVIRFCFCCQDKFELKVGEEVRNDAEVRAIIDVIADNRYRDHRYDMHEHYRKFQDDRSRLQNPPIGVRPEEWAWLVNYFGSTKYQVIKIYFILFLFAIFVINS